MAQSDDTEESSLKITQSDIGLIHHKSVHGFCRSLCNGLHPLFSKKMSLDILDLILFFYAMPTRVIVTGDDTTNHILVSPVQVQGDWDAVTRQLCAAFDAEDVFASLWNRESATQWRNITGKEWEELQSVIWDGNNMVHLKWSPQKEKCAICRNGMTELCIACESLKRSMDCHVSWGTCNHVYHNHCIIRWLRFRPRLCPFDSSQWEYPKFEQ